MRIHSEIFEKLSEEGVLQNNYHLPLIDTPDEDMKWKLKSRLSKMKMESLLNNNSYFIFARSSKDVPVNTDFDVLFPLHNPEDFIVVKARLKYVNVNVNREIEYLPKGYSGVCLIEFEAGKPELLNKVGVYNQALDPSEHDMLYLSQKPVLDRILELMKES